MAKIYETKEDVERERLANEAAQHRVKADADVLSGGVFAFMGSALGQAAGRVTKDIEESSTKVSTRTKIGKWALIAGAGLASITAAVGFVGGFLDWRRARKAEAELKKLGPQQIVIPEDAELPMPLTGAATYARNSGHVERLQKARDTELAAPSVAKP